MLPHSAQSTLFPYTTLFRSDLEHLAGQRRDQVGDRLDRLDFAVRALFRNGGADVRWLVVHELAQRVLRIPRDAERRLLDRKSTRLNSSHLGISYAVFCLKQK